mmetsp:Transcript_54201/g.107918  ORF Transcript_54201/g.107918 Transcript_54201/m.107918 type:complete len:257 (-) Transcript_54201:1530-2300(-)
MKRLGCVEHWHCFGLAPCVVLLGATEAQSPRVLFPPFRQAMWLSWLRLFLLLLLLLPWVSKHSSIGCCPTKSTTPVDSLTIAACSSRPIFAASKITDDFNMLSSMYNALSSVASLCTRATLPATVHEGSLATSSMALTAPTLMRSTSTRCSGEMSSAPERLFTAAVMMELWSATNTNNSFGAYVTTAYSIEAMTVPSSLPTTLPIILCTMSSPLYVSNIFSIGTRNSAPPTTTARGSRSWDLSACGVCVTKRMLPS